MNGLPKAGLLSVIVSCLFLGSQALAAAPKVETGEVQNLAPTSLRTVDLSDSTYHKMSNDLEVILQAIPGAPRVSVCTAFDAGSRLDPISAPGAYRVLAEMLKEGGYRSTSQDYAALVARRGGLNSLSVTHDSTTFCTTAPAGEVSLALWVTAGRFTAGALTQELLEKVVDRLAQESDLLDAQVRTGRANDRLRRMAFLGTATLARPVLPNADDLDSLSLETILRLHRKSYVARRATVALSGGFSEKAVIHQLSEHLLAARAGTKSRYRVASLVSQSTGRFSMAEDRNAKTPAAWYGWVLPAGKDRLAAEVALAALVSHKRLGGKLIGQSRAAKSVELYLDQDAALAGHALARMEIVGSNSRSLGTIEKGFETELRLLSSRGPTQEEVRGLQRTMLQERAFELNSAEQRSRALATGVRLGRSPAEVLSPLKEGAELEALSTEKVRQAALMLLAPHRRSSIEIYPKGWQDPWQKPMHQYHIVSKGQTLGAIARRYGTSVAVILKINGIKRNKPIYPGDKLRVPRSKAKKAEKKPRAHRVKRGDTLGALALRYGVSSHSIAAANGMGSKSTIRTGETLSIPWTRVSSGKSSSPKKGDKGGSGSSAGKKDSGPATLIHKVKKGETLSGIAKKRGVSTTALARANGLSNRSGVRIGQKLKVPSAASGKKSSVKSAPLKVYKVKKGDTLSGIARRHGVSVAELTVANKIGRKSTLRLGQSLKIPAKK